MARRPTSTLFPYTTLFRSGVRMGSLFRRLLIAWTIGDIAKVPFSDDITSESVLLMRRNIQQRVFELAPFLLFDRDRKSTRLNSSHSSISYAVFCLKKKQ